LYAIHYFSVMFTFFGWTHAEKLNEEYVHLFDLFNFRTNQSRMPCIVAASSTRTQNQQSG